MTPVHSITLNDFAENPLAYSSVSALQRLLDISNAEALGGFLKNTPCRHIFNRRLLEKVRPLPPLQPEKTEVLLQIALLDAMQLELLARRITVFFQKRAVSMVVSPQKMRALIDWTCVSAITDLLPKQELEGIEGIPECPVATPEALSGLSKIYLKHIISMLPKSYRHRMDLLGTLQPFDVARSIALDEKVIENLFLAARLAIALPIVGEAGEFASSEEPLNSEENEQAVI